MVGQDAGAGLVLERVCLDPDAHRFRDVRAIARSGNAERASSECIVRRRTLPDNGRLGGTTGVRADLYRGTCSVAVRPTMGGLDAAHPSKPAPALERTGICPPISSESHAFA